MISIMSSKFLNTSILFTTTDIHLSFVSKGQCPYLLSVINYFTKIKNIPYSLAEDLYLPHTHYYTPPEILQALPATDTLFPPCD